jgi:hypothetical protein
MKFIPSFVKMPSVASKVIRDTLGHDAINLSFLVNKESEPRKTFNPISVAKMFPEMLVYL